MAGINKIPAIFLSRVHDALDDSYLGLRDDLGQCFDEALEQNWRDKIDQLFKADELLMKAAANTFVALAFIERE